MTARSLWLDRLGCRWPVARLKDHVSLINGFPFDSQLFSHSRGTRLVRIRDLADAGEATYVDAAVPAAAMIDSGDLIVGMDGDFSTATWDSGPAALNQRLCVLRSRPTLDQRFLGYLLPIPLKAINDVTYFTTVKHLSSFELLDERIPLPPLGTQMAIANFLDRETARIDSLLTAKRRMVELIREYRESSAADLVNRAKDLGSTVPLWTVIRPEETTGAPELEVLSVYRDHGVIPKSSRSDNYNKTPADLSRYQVVWPGDVVVNKMKAWQGSIGVSKYHGIVSPDYLVCRLLRPIDPSFLHHVLRSPQLRVEYLSRSEGIRPAQWRLQWDQMRLIELPVPDEDAQATVVAAHAEEVARSQKLISALVRQIELLQERRQTVITDAVTGNIHTPAAA